MFINKFLQAYHSLIEKVATISRKYSKTTIIPLDEKFLRFQKRDEKRLYFP